MSTATEHFDLVKQLIQDSGALSSESSDIELSQPLYSLGISSLNTVNLLVELSLEFDVDLEDHADDIEPPKTVADLCNIAQFFQQEQATCS